MAVSLLQKALKLQVAGGWESVLGKYYAMLVVFLCSSVDQNKLYMCVLQICNTLLMVAKRLRCLHVWLY